VGGFALLIVAGALAFVLWMGRANQGASAGYVVKFNQSVAGLSVGSDVVFNGVRVGQVDRITLSRLDPSSVTVAILVAADTPVRRNSVASLEMRGITGLAMVSITGGTADSPLVPGHAGTAPEISSRASGIQTIMESAPEILTNLNILLERANDLLSPENATALNTLLVSLAEIMDSIAQGRDSIARTVGAIDKAATEMAELAESVASLSDSARQLVSGRMSTAVDSLAQVADGVRSILSSVEPGLQRLSREAAEDLPSLLGEARNLLNKLAAIASQIESDPRRFFFGNSVPEYSRP
jgi:phospholipid/cholesterol/gamma-HCH transport system substrate-binding protein